ncbi:MAG TPA: hypothetical protein VD816_04660 [Ohtaekwangia sp.]|nr:hypothetical protein [Ohtaekwangia sp.]
MFPDKQIIRSGKSSGVLMLAVLFCFTSCYNYKITSNRGSSTELQSQVVHNFLWGLIEKPKGGLFPKNCAPGGTEDAEGNMGFHYVRAESNFGYALLTVVTLGIWSPMRIEWQCAKPCPMEGEL